MLLPLNALPKTRQNTRSFQNWSLETSGSFKSIGQYESLRQENVYPKNSLALTEQRLRVQAALTNQWLRLEFANQTSVYYQTNNPSSVPVPSYNPVPAWNTLKTLGDPNALSLTSRIDRAYAQVHIGELEFRVGKQVISTGVGHFFNAISQVPRYPFIIIDPEFPVTEDAFTGVWEGPLTLEARFLPKTPGQANNNFHLRAKSRKDGADFALTTGRSDDKIYIGVEMAGNLGDSLARAELIGYNTSRMDYVQALIGMDTVFSPSWSAQWEVFYNGFGTLAPYTLTPSVHRPAPYRGKYYLAGSINWDATELMKLNLSVMSNIADPSALFHFFISYSLFENVDLIAGQFLNVGGRNAEFGGLYTLPLAPQIKFGLPDETYVLLRAYF